MKKTSLLLILLLLVLLGKAQTGVNTRTPDASANMEVSSTNKGLLIPRLSVSNILNKAPVTVTPKDGLLIYNTNTATKKTLFHWDVSNNSGNGAWNTHLFFKETPKTAVIGFTGPNMAVLDNKIAGGVDDIAGASNSFSIISSGYLPSLGVSKSAGNLLQINLGPGLYMIELSLLITAPAPDAGRGTPLQGAYYNMAYFTDVYVKDLNNVDVLTPARNRVERSTLATVDQPHRVTFSRTIEIIGTDTSQDYILTTRIGRRFGSSHNDLVYIIPAGSYYKLTKLR